MNCVYKLYNYDKLIYIGQSINTYARLRNHLSLQPWKEEITHIAIAECPTKIDMDLYEKYYINKLNPIYNKALVYNEIPTIKFNNLSFKKYTLSEFLGIEDTKIIKPKKISKREQMINELLKRSIEINEKEKVNFLNTSETLFYLYNSSKTILETIEISKDNTLFKQLLVRIKNGECTLTGKYYYFDFGNREDIFEHYGVYDIDLRVARYDIYKNKMIEKGSYWCGFVTGATKNDITGNVTLKLLKDNLDNHFNKYFKY